MFVAEALYNFSKASLATAQSKQEEEPLYKQDKADEQEEQTLKRAREEDHEQELAKEGEDKFYNKNANKNKEDQGKEEKGGNAQQIAYLNLEKGDKILVQQAYENGWWFGHVIKRPNEKGFFPSNYVKAGAKPPPPAPPKHKPEEEEDEDYQQEEDNEANEVGGKLDQLGEVQMGPVASDYYQGITRYKYVKINDNNKNILNASYVKFDAATGLAKVPVKDQAPCAKAVRQMGYYFDYHQWNEERNKNPEAYRNRPDPRKKRQKKLRLVGMGKDA